MINKNFQSSPSTTSPSQSTTSRLTKNSTKSQKVLQLLNFESESHRPFRRKQQSNHNNANVNKKKKYDDVGKLISNTSFGGHPDIRRIVSVSPVQCLSPKPQYEEKKLVLPKERLSLRQNKSLSELEKANSSKKYSPQKLLGNVQNLSTQKRPRKSELTPQQQKQHNSQNHRLKLKIQSLTLQKMQILQKYQTLSKRVHQIQMNLVQKQNTISKLNLQLTQKNEQKDKQFEINKCLQEIISQLNSKIDDLLSCNQFQHSFLHEVEYSILEGDFNQENRGSREELEAEIQFMKEKIYNLNKTIQALEIQSIAMKKLRYQLQKQKSHVKVLEKQNKTLKQKLLNFMKLNKVKSAKLSLKKQLQYSISFQFQD